MNLKTRIEKLESQINKDSENGVAWDFSQTTNEQLLRLENLVLTDTAEAERYTRQLINDGYLRKNEHQK